MKTFKCVLDPDADGKQWLYRGCVIMDQRGYGSGLASFCVDDAKGRTFPAYSLKDAKRVVDMNAAHVVLTEIHERKLNDLWFVYGNYGKKHTPGNHYFIQRLLDMGQDTRYSYSEGNNLTKECIAAVDAILNDQ
jgi:hypothetical protein